MGQVGDQGPDYSILKRSGEPLEDTDQGDDRATLSF